MKKLFTLLFLAFLFNMNLIAGDIYLHLLTTGQPANTYYLGDIASEYYINFEVGQTSWNATDVGIGTSNTGSGENWQTAEWYEDGDGNNKRVRTNIAGTIFNITGSWYFYGRAKAEVGDPWHYANNGAWGNSSDLSATEFFTIEEIPNPPNFNSETISSTKINLSWTQWNSKNVMIVRKTSAQSWTEPTQGTAYAASATIGDGIVVYNGSETSFSNTSLTANTTYDYKFYSVNNDYYSVGQEILSTTTGKSISPSANGNWNSTSTWNSGSIPTSIDDVNLTSTYLVNVDVESATCANLTINSESKLEVNTGQALTVENAILIKSDATNTGSLINKGTISGNITIERYMTNYSTANNGWHLISSPVSDFTIAGSDFAPVSGDDDLYKFDETVNSENWLNYDGGTFGDTKFEVGKGYLAAYKNAITKEFSGSITTGSVTKNLSWTDNATYEGLNLMGNPFTSAIDWDEVTKTAGVGVSVYVLQASTNQYLSWNGSTGDLTDGIIPSMQGFFTYANALSQSITMESDDQVHQTNPYYKSVSELAANTMKLNVVGTEGTSNTYLQFREDATTNFDIKTDAYKIFGYTTAPEIYTTDLENNYSINCLPLNRNSYDVTLGINNSNEGDYSIVISNTESIEEMYSISIEDNKTGTLTDVTNGTEINYSSEDGDDPNRFTIHFGVVGIEDQPEVESIQSFVHGQQLTVIGNTGNTLLEIINIQGQIVLSEKIQLDGRFSKNLNLKSGIYIVRTNSISNKVIVSN